MSSFFTLYKRILRKLRYLSIEGDGLMVVSFLEIIFGIAAFLGEATVGYSRMVVCGMVAVGMGVFRFCFALGEISGVVAMRVAHGLGGYTVGFAYTVYSALRVGVVNVFRGIHSLLMLFAHGFIFSLQALGRGSVWCFLAVTRVCRIALHSIILALQSIGLIAWRVGSGLVRGIRYGAQAVLDACVTLGRVSIFVLSVLLRSMAWAVRRIGSMLVSGVYGFSRSTARTTVRAHHATGSFVRSFDVSHPPMGWQRSVVGFVVVSMFFVLPFPALYAYQDVIGVKNRAQAQGKDAIGKMQYAQDALTGGDMKGALAAFNEAYQSFQDTEKTVDSINDVVRWGAEKVPTGGKQLSDAESLVSAGKDFSLAGRYLSWAAETASQLTSKKDPTEFSSLIISLEENLTLARPHLKHAVASLGDVDSSSLPSEYRASFENISSIAPRFEEVLDHAIAVTGLLRYMIGVDTQRRFLIVLQNETELRPTGGFMGTVAIVDIDQGKIKNISVPGGGPYDFRGTLTEHVTSPHPLWLVNPAWQMQDANWFPDFPESAAKTAWFYKKSGGSTVDGVIAINSSVASDLIRLLGDVSMPAYNKTITPDNVLIELQKAVEVEYDRTENKPKKILADLLPIIVQRLGVLPAEQYGDAGALLLGAFDRKQIQVYATDEQQETSLKTLGIAGEMKPVDGDYLMLVDTNIGGGKTDGHIQSKASYTVQEGKNGVLTATLTVSRTHTGGDKDMFANANNVDYFRAYTPKGSRLIHAEGFTPPERTLFKNPPLTQKEDADLKRIEGESAVDDGTTTAITQEGDKTVFGNWIQTKPQSTSTVTLVYELPFTTEDLALGGNAHLAGYRLYIQKQSGSSLGSFQGSVVLGKKQTLLWASKAFEKGSATFSWDDTSVGKDIILGSIFQK